MICSKRWTMTSARRSLAAVLLLFSFDGGHVGAANSSLTVVAPDWITDKTRAEARVSIRNPLATPQTYNLELYVDSPLGRQNLATTPINVPANGQMLHSSWFSTKGLAGANTVGYRVTGAGQPEMTGQSPLTVVASPTRAVPLITAAWIDPGALLYGVYPANRAMNANDLRKEVDNAHAVGIDTLIISYSEFILYGWGTFYPSQTYPSSLSYDAVGTILNQASKNGQRVIVGLGRGNDLNLTFDGLDDPQRLAAALAHDTLIATEMWNLYANEPSFYGWYLAHETNDVGAASTGYYNNSVDMLRNFAADKPILISPAGTPLISPAILANSHVDIFAYQDAVGAGYIPYVYTYDPQQRIAMLNSVYASYAAAHTNVNKHLWSNLENWQMNGPTYANAYPASISRVLQQLEIEKHYVDVISSYEWVGFTEDPSSTVNMWGSQAKNLYTGYRDYFRQMAPTLKTVNYAVNSGFEQGPMGDGVVPTGWTFTGNGTTQRVAYSSDTPTSTAAAVNLQIDQNAGIPWLIQDVPVTAGMEYQFSAWAKRLAADPSGGWLAAQVWMLADANSPTIISYTALLFTSADWDYQSSLIAASSGATVARIILGLQDSSYNVGTGSYLIDGVALVGARVPGDYNSDGFVNALDYAVWRSTFGSATDRRADGNFDGWVDAADYVFWRKRVTDAAGAGAVNNAAVVPEPAPLVLTIAGLLMAACCSRISSRGGTNFQHVIRHRAKEQS